MNLWCLRPCDPLVWNLQISGRVSDFLSIRTTSLTLTSNFNKSIFTSLWKRIVPAFSLQYRVNCSVVFHYYTCYIFTIIVKWSSTWDFMDISFLHVHNIAYIILIFTFVYSILQTAEKDSPKYSVLLNMNGLIFCKNSWRYKIKININLNFAISRFGINFKLTF